MSPEFEKFLMEKINLIFKVAKWIGIIYLLLMLSMCLGPLF